MRIVRVSLENLNSLRGEHAVDFSAEPIAGAGLFAITGATGAGKTTLLDAITLALYGRVARYEGSGVPKDMMSRHTGECRAEAEFEVAGGVYRAVWQLRRSHGKADGKLQHPKRYLYDSAGVVLAEQVRAVDELVERLCGLNYERFMRSVLLAQGEFAKFLKAKSSDRAGLLESLTGTQVYSELGALAYEEAARRESELALKEGALGLLVVLDDESRAGLEQEEEGAREEVAKVRARRARYDKEVQKGARLRDEVEAAGRVREAQAKLKLKRMEASDPLARLARHRQVAPVIPLLDRLEDAEERAQRIEGENKEAESLSREAEAQWREGLRGAWAFAVAKFAKVEEEMDSARREIGVADGLRREAEVWLKRSAGDAGLGEALGEIGRSGSDWEHVRETLERARVKLSEMEKVGEEVRKRAGVAKVEWEKAKGAAEKANADLEIKRGAVLEWMDGRSEEEWRKELNALSERRVVLGQLRMLDDVLRKAVARKSESERKLGELVAAAEKANGEVTASEEAWKRCGEVLEARRGHLESAKLVASYEERRAELKEGEACPLCGSEEHPFVDGEGNRSAALDEIEAKVDEARVRLDKAEEKRRVAREGVVRLGSERGAAEKEIRDAGEESRLAREKMASSGEAGFDDEALEEAAKAVRVGEEKLRAIRKAQEEMTVSDGDLARAVARGERFKTELGAREEEGGRLKVDREKLVGEISELEGQLKKVAQNLESALKPYGFEFEDGTLELGWREALAERARKYVETSKERDGAEKELTRLRGVEKELGQRGDGLRRWRNGLAERGGGDGEPGKLKWESREEAEEALARWERTATELKVTFEEKRKQGEEASALVKKCSLDVEREVGRLDLGNVESVRAARLGEDELRGVDMLEKELGREDQRLQGAAETHGKAIDLLRSEGAKEGADFSRIVDLRVRAEREGDGLSEKLAGISERLKRDGENRRKRKELGDALEVGRKGLETWKKLRGLIGSADGSRFSRFAQGISLEVLTGHANAHLALLSDRYVIRRAAGEELELELEIVDRYQGDARRPMSSLSGGESFLVSLALALGLSDLAGRNVKIESLFIDEGFGALDAETLDVAISALESLRLYQKTVGVISHIDLLKERISTQVVVEKGVGGVGNVYVKSG